MVGVGGRSKACEPCRKRRVRCDEGRPTCGRCQKAGRVCGGYHEMTILFYEGEKREAATTKHPSNRERGKNDQSAQSRLSNSNKESSNEETTWDLSDNMSFDKYSTDGETLDMVPSQSSADFSDKLLFDFNSTDLHEISPWKYIPPQNDDVFINYTFARLTPGNANLWLQAFKNDTVLSEGSFLALCTFYFGNEHRHQSIVNRGLQRYGHALKSVNRALTSSSKLESLDLLNAITILTLLEMLMSNTLSGWVGHCLGLQELMGLRGPESFSSKWGLQFFQKCRPMILWACMAVHKPILFARDDWKTIPWQQSDEPKPLFEQLIDIMTDVPELLALIDHLTAAKTPEKARLAARKIYTQSSAITVELEIWRATWLAAEGSHMLEIPPNNWEVPNRILPNGQYQPYWTSNLSYTSLQHANANILYHATVILVFWLSRKALPHIPEEPTLHSYTLATAYASCIDICRSVESYLDYVRGAAEGFYILWPLKMAWNAGGKGDETLGAWLEDVVRRIENGAAGRWALAGYVLNINQPDTRGLADR